MESNASTSSSTDGTSQVATLGPRPTPPRQRLTAAMNPLLRDIDWNGHVPAAPEAAPSLTRAEVQEQIADTDGDDNERWLPKLPAQRPAPKQPTKVPGQRSAYENHVLGVGAIHAHSAFAA